MKYCKICMKEFIAKTNTVCCSKECRLENKRQNRRRSWHRCKQDRYSENLRLKMWRIRKRIENDNTRL